MSDANGAVLVTGATGFIGQNLAQRLLADGRRVRALVRKEADAPRLRAAGLEVEIGDIGDAEALGRALSGVGAVAHLATWKGAPPTWRAARAVNVGGARAVLAAARLAGVPRIVFTSSLSVLGPPPPVDLDEAATPRARDAYGVTKIEAEVAFLAEPSLAIAVLRAAHVFGPGDLGWTTFFANAARAKRPAFIGDGQGTFAYSYVANFVDACVAALTTNPAPRGVFHIVDGATTWADFASRIAREVGGTARGAPLTILRAAALAMRVPELLTGWVPFLTADRIDEMTSLRTFSSGRARAELAWTPQVGFDEAMSRSTAWLRAQEGS